MARFPASSGRQFSMKPLVLPAWLMAWALVRQFVGPVNRLRSRTVGSAALTAGMPTFEALPSEAPPWGQDGAPFSPQPRETSDCCEKGTRRRKNVVRFEAASFRLVKTASWASEAA